METTTAGWQLDFFGEAAAIIAPPPAIESDAAEDTVVDESLRERLADALIDLACGSRHGVNMPESLLDCAKLLRQRIRNESVDLKELSMTIGWIFGFWDGAIPYTYVCEISGVSPEVLQDVILGNARLMAVLDDVKRQRYGSLL
ncbi:hypothetical protein [Cupriavidus pampae]|uniref:Uncharacterized protein n=1 Tax=Cupriavidus pampae TaxID=659251 RepID=A0ABN7ZPJ8_9BURK|nr:hypothetical protein [Cupriavidus pampae]CAG9186915.1 hypothetical protein LMG32289_06692 [Cupriavidus pampae]